jgi:hypothetical protein
MAETTAKPTLEEFAEEARKLHALFSDPQPGLMSWHQFREERMQNMADMLRALGY